MKKYYIFLLLGLISAIFVAIFMILKMETYLYKIEMEKIKVNYRTLEERLKDFTHQKDTFIKMISEYHSVEEFFSSKNTSSLETTKIFFYNLVKGSETIMQLRLLDISGMECIRIDRTPTHEIVQIKTKDLQDKSKRNYFKKFSKLNEKSVGFSSLDLNIENNKVEVPWRPTLRIGIPVFVDGTRVGMVIINYNMADWLENISKITLNNFYLVDLEGYFIIHPNEGWKWSRYQTPAKNMNQYFTRGKKLKNDFSNIDISDNLFVKKINFFNNESMFAIYEPKIPIDTLLYEKVMQVTGIILVIFILLLVPVIILIALFINNLNKERDNLKQSKGYIETIFNNAFDAMFVINKLGIIQNLNLSAEKLFGYSKSELIGKNIKILIPEPHHTKHDEYLRAYTNDGHSTVLGLERELHALDKTGKEIPIILAVSRMESSGELSFIGSIRDYSQLKLIQEQKTEQETMLLQQSKFAAMGEMLSAIAHQWRQPLNSVGLIIQDLASAEKYGELNTEYLQKSKDGIMDQVHLMSDTIDEFRNFFTKSNAKKIFNIIDIIEEVYHLYWAQFNASGIEFELLCRGVNGTFVLCNKTKEKTNDRFTIEGLPSELKQTLLNLLANAKDAIDTIPNPTPYQKKLIVSIDVLEDKIEINVCDNAGGMDEMLIKRIFEPYYTTKKMGTGLGLFIVKTLINKHLKGTISCKNQESQSDGVIYKGAVFSIIIPKSIDEESS